MKKFFKEFRDFIQKGNVLDLAVGIIVGTAFNKIVSSLVNDIIMPVVGLIGGKNIQDAKVELVPAVMDGEVVVAKAVTLNYGMFIQYIIDFLIIAFTVFVIVKVLKGMRKRAESTKEKLFKRNDKGEVVEVEEVPAEEVVVKPTSEDLLTEIRDLLKESKANK